MLSCNPALAVNTGKTSSTWSLQKGKTIALGEDLFHVQPPSETWLVERNSGESFLHYCSVQKSQQCIIYLARRIVGRRQSTKYGLWSKFNYKVVDVLKIGTSPGWKEVEKSVPHPTTILNLSTDHTWCRTVPGLSLLLLPGHKRKFSSLGHWWWLV